MNKEQGFSLKPETYNQKEWYELFMNLSKEYRKKCNIINEIEKWLEERVYGMNEIHTYKIGALEDEVILDKLKELKENNK